MRNAVERAVILAKENRISPQDFPSEMHLNNVMAAYPDGAFQVGAMVSLDRLEETHIRKVLATVPNLSEAADILG